jgi:hypothetical protein
VVELVELAMVLPRIHKLAVASACVSGMFIISTWLYPLSTSTIWKDPLIKSEPPADQSYYPSSPEIHRYESVDHWRPSDSFSPAYQGNYRPKHPSPYKFKSVGDFLKQPVVDDYAKGADKVFLMVKTRGGDLWKRLPVHLFTTLTRVPKFSIYSNAPGSIGGYEVIDILANLSDKIYQTNEFTTYRHHRLSHDAHGNIGYEDTKIGDLDLDKFMYLPILAHAYTVSPDSDWFVFMGAESYLFFDNLLELLRKLKPQQHMYMGRLAGLPSHSYAHGETGFVVSQKTMRESFGKFGNLASKYEEMTFKECCGDKMVAIVFSELFNLYVTHHEGFSRRSYLDTPLKESNWCDPVLSFHNLLQHEIEILWEYEKLKRLAKKPILYSDIYRDFILPYVDYEIADWNNNADHKQGSAKDDEEHGIIPYAKGGNNVRPYESVEACRNLCKSTADCLSFRLKPITEECYTADYLKIGKASFDWQRSVHKEDINMTSGWLIDKIRDIRQNSGCDSIVGGVQGVDMQEGWSRRDRAAVMRWNSLPPTKEGSHQSGDSIDQ